MKIEGWEKRLIDYAQSCVDREFAYGELDCVTFASDAVMCQVNIDPMLEGRGQYKSLRKGARLIKELRGSYRGIMDHYFKEISPYKAQRGDIVMARIDNEPCFGVVFHSGNALFKGRGKGLVPLKVKDCKIAWRVE